MRVVSLVPSATELLCAMGGEDLLVGRSHDSTFPPSVLDRPIVTTTRVQAASPAAIDREVRQLETTDEGIFTLDEVAMVAAAPDVILTQETCGVCSITTDLVNACLSSMTVAPTVVSLDPRCFEDVLDDLLTIGEAVGRPDHAQRAMVDLRARWWSAQDHVNPYLTGLRCCVLEWCDPLFVAAHWTPQLLRAGGATPVIAIDDSPSVALSSHDLIDASPEAIVIAPCGVALEETPEHVARLVCQPWWRDLPAVASGRVALVDGTATFSRPGPRLVDTLEWLVGWLHDTPSQIPASFQWRPLS